MRLSLHAVLSQVLATWRGSREGLFTVGAVTGVVRMFAEEKHIPPAKNVAIALALAGWFVYAVVLHSPLNPTFRGRRAAVLSVVGFVLMVGTIFAVQFS